MPETRRIGRALQAALTQEGPGEDLEIEGPSLSNARRRLGSRPPELRARGGRARQSASRLAAELADAGLVSIVEDGRFRRVYPTDVLARKRDANRARVDAFVGHLLRGLPSHGRA